MTDAEIVSGILDAAAGGWCNCGHTSCRQKCASTAGFQKASALLDAELNRVRAEARAQALGQAADVCEKLGLINAICAVLALKVTP